ncbi:diacylglycerol kinase family protein [Marinilactibacillus sp. XAAS-LB27]|uniref:diacylglycerol/lipid kinase family protein n=1 Tax=Marinilactibacillus sp. XAAS-LB27 TaxID=3114538 RepID=UPI002E17D429|nr:diacylglycerol kinase family protein [Marinilactibacillus sp. XAAS-LB27]
MKEVMIIANPSSGKKQAEEFAVRAQSVFKENGRTADIKITEKEADIGKFAREACEEKYEIIIALGGDGTVSGLGDALKDEPYRPKIGIIPTGTVNNIARGLGISTDMAQAVEDLANCVDKKADAGLINGRLFLSSISAGSIPETVWEVSKESKERFGSLAYFFEGIRSLTEDETFEVELTLDGKTSQHELSLLLIGLSNSIAGIPNFFKDATYDDGQLYLFGLEKSTLGEKITAMTSLFKDDEDKTDDENKGFVWNLKEATIKSSHDGHVALDGEKGPAFPLDIKVLPSFFTFLVPENMN